MPKHIEQVEAHARARLGGGRRKDRSRADLLQIYKRFLKLEEYRIRLQHRAGGGGFEICRKRSDLLDVVLRNLFEEALAGHDTDGPPVTLVATGGYGRALLNPGSDIDLLFLCRTSGARMPKTTAEIIEQILYMLWDVGFKVGHATRSIRETVRQANADPQTKSALIESRLVTGDQAFFEEFKAEFRKSCILRHEDEYLQDRLADLKRRYAKYSNTVYLQEPNVKNGVGGLRDFHNLTWITYVKRGTLDLKSLLDEKILTLHAYRELEKAHDFLLRVRNDLHYSERRATDILTLRLQGVIATNFKYPQKSILRRCEEFMRDYYSHTRALSQHTTSLMERFEIELEEPSASRRLVNFLAMRHEKIEYFDGFQSKAGWLYPENSKIFAEDPNRLMRAFQHLQQRHLKMSPQLRQLIKRHWSLIDRPFRYRKKVRETFEAILSRKGDVARTVRIMHRAGVLGRYLPEFGALTCLVQHEFFHRYTADEHTLKCIDKLDELSDTEDPRLALYQDLFHRMEDPFVLYLALILHDTGRAANVRTHADASAMLANRVCNRLGIRLDRRRLLIFLVDHHLTFWRTATTKNIADPNVIEEFAAIVRNKFYLDCLLLLTYADSKGTNEEAWSDWKESLMRQLYHSTALFFEDRGAYDSRMRVPADRIRHEVYGKLSEDHAEEIERHFELMPKRYFLFRSADSVARHVRVFRRFRDRVETAASAAEAAGESPPLVDPEVAWHDRPERGGSEVYVCAMDRPGLLALITGALAANGINVLGADLYVRGDGIALDVFQVCTTDFEPVSGAAQREAVQAIIRDGFRGADLDIDGLIRKAAPAPPPSLHTGRFPTRVRITNDASPDYTVIELQALDRLGLLHDVFRTIVAHGGNVAFARINTEKGAAIDTFYITDGGAGKLRDEERIRALSRDIDRYISVPADGAGA